MDDAALAMAVARFRVALGLGALVAPGLTARLMIRRREHARAARVFIRMLGGRDVALGLGTVIALDRGAPVRGWVEGSALADTIDCVACTLGREELTPVAFAAAVGLGAASAALGAVLSRRLDPPPPAQPGQPEAVATGHPEPGPGA